ncbi:MAG: hypothetical protein V3R99_03805 [Thermoguttaceae bacterium]
MSIRFDRLPSTLATCFLLLAFGADIAPAADLTLELGNSDGVTLVGALNRWDRDGNLRRPVNPKAKIDSPGLDAVAKHAGGNRWVFDNLPPGRYDLLILAKGPMRIEGWQYAPVLEFDPFLSPDAKVDPAVRRRITEKIAASPHYENRVEPLHMAGDRQTVRVLMRLIRDKPTSYKPGLGTIRHEIWQFTYRYGGWAKEKRTRVMDRHLLPVSELQRWTWKWDPRLGGIEVKAMPMNIKYDLPPKVR